MSENWEQWYTAEGALVEERLQDRLKESLRRSPRYARLAANMVRDDRVPTRAKAALVAGSAYVLSPIDLIPGIIPVLGQIDDLVAIMVAIRSATRLCPPELVDEHLEMVNLTHADMARDAETAQIAGKWAARRGLSLVKSAAYRSAQFTAGAARRGREALGNWRSRR
ncbi:hypothetical protein BH24CHL4_BH24CHL4_27080 [soil metagenome]